MSDTQHKPYGLPRNPHESARLNAQHKGYTQNIGYLLNPTIVNAIPQNALIADVGCGTGAWMLDVASTLPSMKIEGLDISREQFPASHPENCTFQTYNLLDPVPPELQGRYDAVHMRLLVIGLTGQQWATAAAHAQQLLKPGGWLQWCEGDFEHQDILQTRSGASRAALAEIFALVIGMNQRYGKFQGEVRALPRILQQAGFQRCAEDVIGSDNVPETRFPLNEVEQQAMVSASMQLALTDPEGCGYSPEQVEELSRRCDDEMADGKVYWRFNMHVVIGQRPL